MVRIDDQRPQQRRRAHSWLWGAPGSVENRLGRMPAQQDGCEHDGAGAEDQRRDAERRSTSSSPGAARTTIASSQDGEA